MMPTAEEDSGAAWHEPLEIRSIAHHIVLLLAYLLPVVTLAKRLAVLMTTVSAYCKHLLP
jgi:hypothetical protein